MNEFVVDASRPAVRYSLRSLLGVHGAAAGVCEFVCNAPLVAALIGVMAAFVLLQFGVLAACTWHVPRSVR